MFVRSQVTASAARPETSPSRRGRTPAHRKPYVNNSLERSRQANEVLTTGGGAQFHELGSDRHAGLVFLAPIFGAMRSEEHAVPSCTLRRPCAVGTPSSSTRASPWQGSRRKESSMRIPRGLHGQESRVAPPRNNLKSPGITGLFAFVLRILSDQLSWAISRGGARLHCTLRQPRAGRRAERAACHRTRTRRTAAVLHRADAASGTAALPGADTCSSLEHDSAKPRAVTAPPTLAERLRVLTASRLLQARSNRGTIVGQARHRSRRPAVPSTLVRGRRLFYLPYPAA